MLDISQWQEKETGSVSLYKNPPNHSTDNNVLFTAVAAKLGLMSESEFAVVALKYMSPPGAILRYPGTAIYMSYDDHLGAACISDWCRGLIKRYMFRHFFFTPDRNWLARFVLFDGALYGNPLAIVALVYSVFESPAQTSGKQLIWLSLPRLRGYVYFKPFVTLWKWAMRRKYPGGLKQMLNTYYPTGHPFIDAAPATWDGA